ncbi:MAG: hypothetical protein ABI462_04635 [Ignavibacteria bacterium]
MKNLKSLAVLITMLVLSVFTACSDQLTSSGEISSMKQDGKKPAVEEGIPIEKPVHRIRIRLEAKSTFKIKASQQGYINFTSIDINFVQNQNADKIPFDCSSIFTFGSNRVDFPLSCHSKGFDANEITIQNQSSATLTLDIVLQGSKFKPVVPVQSE